MINIAICDDDKMFCQQEVEYINNIMNKEYPEIEYNTTLFYNAEGLKSGYLENEFDIIFLDIELGEEDGFMVANEIRRMHPNTKIIFVTTHDNLVYDSFDYRPLGFIRKRMYDSEIPMVIKRIIRELVQNSTIIILGELKQKKMFMIQEIMYIETYKHNLMIYQKDEQFQVRDKVKNHQDELLNDGFVQVNRGIMLNMLHVQEMQDKTFIMDNGSSIAISRNYYQDAKTTYEMYKLNKSRKVMGLE